MEDAIRIINVVLVDNILGLLLFACSWIAVYWLLIFIEFLIAKVCLRLPIFLAIRIRRLFYGIPRLKKAILKEDSGRTVSSEASISAAGRYMSTLDRALSKPFGVAVLLRALRFDREAKAIYRQDIALLEADDALMNVLSKDPRKVARGVLMTAGGSLVTRPEALRMLLHAAIFGPQESRDVTVYNIKLFARYPEDVEQIRTVASNSKWSAAIRSKADDIVRQITETQAMPVGKLSTQRHAAGHRL
ncbi:MAG: hypothetical protein MN733_41285 [Nitrososphaera sp.]|nr:hypothetical protein [Nitrososphaera sp.]